VINSTDENRMTIARTVVDILVFAFDRGKTGAGSSRVWYGSMFFIGFFSYLVESI
jgi:hypothetical protein